MLSALLFICARGESVACLYAKFGLSATSEFNMTRQRAKVTIESGPRAVLCEDLGMVAVSDGRHG